MASFVTHNLRALPMDVGLGTKSVCQRDLDAMEKIGDTRKPWDRVVPIYHAMLSEGGRTMHSFLGFLGTVILLLAMVNHAHADTGREDAEGLRAGVVLEAGEIDSSTVEVGALAVVVYGKGERHPTSGEWAKLDTARGYIKAVDQQRLIVGLEPDGWSKWIALESIQTLILVGSSSPGSVDQDSTQANGAASCGLLVQLAQAEPVDSLAVEAESVDSLKVKTDKENVKPLPSLGEFLRYVGNDRAVTRIPKKVGLGTLTMAGVGYISFKVMKAQIEEEEDTPFSTSAWVAYTMAIVFGYPIGVYLADMEESSFWLTFIGNGMGLWYAEQRDSCGVSCLVVNPFTGAIIGSELSRMKAVTGGPKRSQDLRFSFSLVPDIKRGLSAIATLHF